MSHLSREDVEAAAGGQAFEHLGACAECRGAVRDARGRQALLKGLKAYTLSDMAFRRVEARLNEQLEAGLPGARSLWWWLLPLGAAAAALITWVAVGSLHLAPTHPPPPPLALRPAPPWHDLTVVLASGDAQWREAEGGWTPLRAGEVVAQGRAVSGRRVLLAPDAEVPWSFETRGEVSFGTQATVTLGAGEVRAQVKEPAEVLAGPRRVVASDAAFFLSRVAAEVVLEVSRGAVEVFDSAGAVSRRVHAPARVRWADGSALEAGVVDERFVEATKDGGAAALAAVPARPWGEFDVRDLPSGASLSIDGAQVGTTPLSLLLALGRHRVSVQQPGQPAREGWAELFAGRPGVLRYDPALPEREPDRDALARVMEDLRRQRPKLAACYEKWLKANPLATGEVSLLLSVTSTGAVRGAKVGGDAIPAESSACLVRTSKTLVLPPLGADAELEVPLVLRPRGK